MHSFRHDALIHRDDDELVALAVPFVSDGVEHGDAVLVRLSAGQHVALLDALGGPRGVTFMPATEDVGPLSLLARDRAQVAHALQAGAGHVRVLAPAPCRGGTQCLRNEAALTHHLEHLPVWQVCAYDARALPDDVLLDAGRAHGALRSARGVEASSRLEDPRALLLGCAEHEADPLEQQAPAAVLVEPDRTDLMELVERLGRHSALPPDNIDALRLAAVLVLDNALTHGRSPVTVHAWGDRERLVLRIHDAGPGPADPFTGLAPQDAAGRPNGLFLVHEAVSTVSLLYAPDGFAVRLVECA